MFKHFAVFPLAFAFFACIFGGDGESVPNSVKPGFYRADYGYFGDSAAESEFIMDSGKNFHWVGIYENLPELMIQRRWKNSDTAGLWESVMTGYLDDDGFRLLFLDTVLRNDTLRIRGITGDSFEKLETVEDENGDTASQWVPYHLSASSNALATGRYEFTRFRSGHTYTYFFELTQAGTYREGVIRDSLLYYENDGANWLQSGSFLISDQTRELNWIDGTWETLHYMKSAIRIRNVQPDSFQRWISYFYTDTSYWATYRRVAM